MSTSSSTGTTMSEQNARGPPTRINDLPSELLHHIYSQLTNATDIGNFRLACRAISRPGWHKTSQQYPYDRIVTCAQPYGVLKLHKIAESLILDGRGEPVPSASWPRTVVFSDAVPVPLNKLQRLGIDSSKFTRGEGLCYTVFQGFCEGNRGIWDYGTSLAEDVSRLTDLRTLVFSPGFEYEPRAG